MKWRGWGECAASVSIRRRSQKAAEDGREGDSRRKRKERVWIWSTRRAVKYKNDEYGKRMGIIERRRTTTRRRPLRHSSGRRRAYFQLSSRTLPKAEHWAMAHALAKYDPCTFFTPYLQHVPIKIRSIGFKWNWWWAVGRWGNMRTGTLKSDPHKNCQDHK